MRSPASPARPGSAARPAECLRLRHRVSPSPGGPRHRRHLHPPVARPALLVGIRGHRLLGAEGCGEHRGGGQALADQCARHGERALGGELPVVVELLVAVADRPVVGEAAHHQRLVIHREVGCQRRRQGLEQLPACGLQLVGIEREQHAAADADASVVECDPPCRERHRECLFKRLAALLGHFALVHLGFELARQLHLHPHHPDQDENKGAQQPGHQIAEDGKYRGGVLDAGVDLVHRQASSASAAGLPANCCRSSTICFCDMIDRSMISRAWAT